MIKIRNLIILLVLFSIYVLQYSKYLFIEHKKPDDTNSHLKFAKDDMILFCAIASQGATVAMKDRQANVSKEIALFNMVDSIDEYSILGGKLEGLKLKPHGELNFNETVSKLWLISLSTAYERPIEPDEDKKEEVIDLFHKEFLYMCIGNMMKKIY